MTTRLGFLAVCLGLWTIALQAQPLAKPLADFDKMVAELKTSNVVGEPIRAGNTTVIPFASVQFSLGSAGSTVPAAGALAAKTVPLGVVIADGDDVRVDLLEPPTEKSQALIGQLIQAILDRKVSFMVNGLNVGNAPGNVTDLTPMINGMIGQTTVMVNGLNLGNLRAPQPPATEPKPKELQSHQ